MKTHHQKTPVLTIRVSLTPGICRWCRCTYDRPCANGCGWVDRTQTLCTECRPLDTLIATAKGRREIAEFMQDVDFLTVMGPHAKPIPAQPTLRDTRRATRR